VGGYFGVLIGKKIATVAIVLAASHTAAWLGAQTPEARRWIQAGVEGSHPYAYVETGWAYHQRSLRMWPVPKGYVAHVRLLRKGDRWRVVIGTYKSAWYRIPGAITVTTLETNGPAKALIDGRIVVGR
jgi:hypothetical protein